MADYFASTSDFDFLSKNPANSGTASTASDKFEVRFDQTLTLRQVVNGLDIVKRWVMQNGLGAGVNVPPNRN